jgi:hypothetical protein
MSFWQASINGFRCNTQTWDHALNVDGWADEVFIGWSAQVVDKAGRELVPLSTRRTAIMGQTDGWPNRVQAGTRTETGGLQTDDAFPTSQPEKRSGELTSDRVPLLLWRGPLTDDTAIVLIPTIWEWDGGTDAFTGFLNNLRTNGPAIAKAAAESIAVVKPEVGATVVPIVTKISEALPFVVNLVTGILGKAGDRPIGTQEADDGTRSFEPKAYVLNETIANRLVANDFGSGNGVINVDYIDSNNMGAGAYTMFLQLEKLGDGLVDGSLARDASQPEIYVVFGEAKFWLPDPGWVERYGGWSRVQVTPDGTMLAMPNIPKDGTLLREWSDPTVYVIQNRQRRRVTQPELLNPFGGWPLVRVIPDSSLAGIPSGPDLV